MSSRTQFVYRLSVFVDEISRSAVEIGNFDGVGVDAEVAIERSEYFLNVNRSRCRHAAGRIGLADDPPTFYAAAGQKN